MNPLIRKIDREILAAAVGSTMFCPSEGCGAGLDVRDAVLITRRADGASGIACAKCAAPLLERLEARGDLEAFEVIDGGALR